MQSKWGKGLGILLLAGTVVMTQTTVFSFGDDSVEIVDETEEFADIPEEGDTDEGAYTDDSLDFGGTGESGDGDAVYTDEGAYAEEGAEDTGVIEDTGEYEGGETEAGTEVEDPEAYAEDTGDGMTEEQIASEEYETDQQAEQAEEAMLNQLGEAAAVAAAAGTAAGGTESVVSETTAGEAAAQPQSPYLWEYRYVGAANVYLQTICDWLSVYHAERAIEGTGMIPAISIAQIDNEDEGDIRIYGRFLLADYELSGTTLVDRQDELLVGCFHLQKVSDTEYLVTNVEVLDSSDLTGSANVLSKGDVQLAGKLLTGKIKAEQRTRFIRDFVEAYQIPADSYQDGNGTVRPLARTSRTSPSYVARTIEAQLTDQIVTVAQTTGSNAVLQLHERQEDGSWLCTLDVPAFIGKNGLGKTAEGDGRTPVGDFGIKEAFGIELDPGAQIKYTQCDESHYWNCDSTSDRYNQMVSVNDYTSFDKQASEHITDFKTAYLYAMALDYNKEGEPYKGSAIFLHCMGPNSFYTAGCVSVPADAMVYLVRHLKPEARILIDTEDNLKTQYRSAKARKADAEAEGAAPSAAGNGDAAAPADGSVQVTPAADQTAASAPAEDVGEEIEAGSEESTEDVAFTETITTETVLNPEEGTAEEVSGDAAYQEETEWVEE